MTPSTTPAAQAFIDAHPGLQADVEALEAKLREVFGADVYLSREMLSDEYGQCLEGDEDDELFVWFRASGNREVDELVDLAAQVREWFVDAPRACGRRTMLNFVQICS